MQNGDGWWSFYGEGMLTGVGGEGSKTVVQNHRRWERRSRVPKTELA